MTVLMIQSHYQEPFAMTAPLFADAISSGLMKVVREMELTDQHFASARGLITTTHLDQIGFQRFAAAVIAFLDRGGRWIYHGHILRPVLPELGIYRPIENPKRVDLDQVRLYDHPIFSGIDQKTLETNHGVAGFYGRGHNPPPEGAIVINALGPRQVPVDWIWARPKGGEILSHAGNEFWGCGDDPEAKKLLARRATAWLCGELNR
ncbi:hypothetical protein [Xaviernesmea oryzae]|uniref:ThuA-like domain-containing protein n=1 Tax=Xaviernesmea oryzae TaxID=464029 RepID=A0A1X7DUC3_9HYPH|nr:hypothetical protein [Xaviernesmea oryzae]SMF21456.1 hypothetical protein SAMN02982989_5855 [Xaviernesmea oryzae]